MPFFADFNRTFVIGERAIFHCPRDLHHTPYGDVDGHECTIVVERAVEGRRAYILKFDAPFPNANEREPYAFSEELTPTGGIML